VLAALALVVVVQTMRLFNNRGDCMKMNRWVNMCMSRLLVDDLCRRIDIWGRTEEAGVAELDEICQRFDVGWSVAVRITLALAEQRRKMVGDRCKAGCGCGWESWRLLDRQAVAGVAEEAIRCYQAGEPVKRRWRRCGALRKWFWAGVAGVIGVWVCLGVLAGVVDVEWHLDGMGTVAGAVVVAVYCVGLVWCVTIVANVLVGEANK